MAWKAQLNSSHGLIQISFRIGLQKSAERREMRIKMNGDGTVMPPMPPFILDM
jgi:hypothetical protein